MQEHPRIRKVMKWGAAALTLLLMTFWIGSAFVDAGWFGVPTEVSIRFGRLSITWQEGPRQMKFPLPTPSRWAIRWQASPQLGMWFYVGSRAGFRVVSVPLWIFVLGPAAVFALVWRLDVVAGRRPSARCKGCGYSREGLALGAACPECGAKA